MKWTGLNEIREKYLQFFESKGHLRLPSFPLVPINDKSLLLINSGMAPMKKYFTGEEIPPRNRVTTCQKCIRTPDLERVGHTARHGTFFEMLGNFSFGDYFKEEAIAWSWEFLTEWLEIPGELLWPSIYENDEEAYDIWANKIGVNPAHIVRLGKADNFWEHGSGPCGPCSEIYFDRGEKYGCGSPDCKPGCDCDRFMEIWNNVFSQFNNDGNGNYTELAQKNIDTGMGLERLACVMQGVDNMFEVDTIRKVIDKTCEISGKTYGANADNDISIRVITDHSRSAMFMISDNVTPSNEGRGYVLRRIIRRACRHGKLLGINHPFLVDTVTVAIGESCEAYPELAEKKDYILKVIAMEEEKFDATVDAGLSILSNMMKKALAEGKTEIVGEDVFKLYDTFGFPIDLTREIAAEQSFSIDEDEFKKLLDDQKRRAREARGNISGWSDASKNLLAEFPKTEFLGYDTEVCEAKVIGIIVDDVSVHEVNEGDFTLITDKTVFYGEGGGQVGDTGAVYDRDSLITVMNTQKTDGVYVHLCTVASGDIKVGDVVRLEINSMQRQAIKRNHSACHMLQAALRERLGNHVEQAGSYVDAERLRFDFKHFAALTEDELGDVEDLVNAHIFLGESIETKEMAIEDARKTGAMALFGEKYGDVVRVVKMGNFSTELCGGTHLDNTAKAGIFKIISESSVAAGVRRIEATTGLGVLRLIKERDELLEDTARELKANNVADVAKKATSVMQDLKSAKSEIESLNAKVASSMTSGIKDSATDVNGVILMTGKMPGAAVDTVRNITDDFKAENDLAVTVIAIPGEGKVNFVASCGKEAVKRGAHAGNLLKALSAICGGGGGGRPDSAQSGGKQPENVDKALASAPEILASMIK